MQSNQFIFACPQMLWTQPRTFRLESPWMAVQRFMFLNDLSGPNYTHLMEVPINSRRVLSTSRYDSARSWEFSASALNPTVQIFFRDLEKSRAIADFSRHRHLVDPAREIRYCLSCLQHCFHWPYFQFPAVLRCPLHDEELRTRCPKCGAPLGHSEFVPSRFPQPLACPSCRMPFVVKNLANHATDGFPEAEEVFFIATKQLNRLMQVKVVDLARNDIEFDFDTSAVAKLYFNCLYKTAYPNEKHPPWLFGLDTCIRGPANIRIRRHDTVTRESVDDADGEYVEDRLLELMRIYKSVGRHLAKKVRQICGHGRYRRLAFSYEYIAFYGNEYYLLMPADSCPCCAVLDWWRARLANQFGLRQYLMKSFMKGPHKLAIYRDWLCDIFPMEAEDAAFSALAIFTSLSIRMLGLLGGQREDAGLLLELYRGFVVKDIRSVRTTDLRLRQQYFGEDSLRLYIPRHRVVRETIRTELDGQRRDFCFSFDSAFTALKQCSEIRRAGLLWTPRHTLGSFTVSEPTRYPRWYEDMAIHANNRYWRSARDREQWWVNAILTRQVH
ncbi:hypothetical protein SAMN05216344_112115 [Polaromonas sp. OV174]|nr:hypothetical protein SAMN05216344_112115 [Polaromonas sp. OV174]